MNKFLLACILFMCVIGFSMSAVSAKADNSKTNTMEVGKAYIVDIWGESNTSTDTINIFHEWIIDSVSEDHGNPVWKNYLNKQDLRDDGIVKVETVIKSNLAAASRSVTEYGVYKVTPLVKGDFTTVTQHKVLGDKTYYWHFV